MLRGLLKYMGDSKTSSIDKIKQVRWERFLLRDKDPYVCYRFVILIEKLLPLELTQLKPVAMDVEQMPDIADRIIIETDVDKVVERYLTRVYKWDKHYMLSRDRLGKLREVVGDYIFYLKSNQEVRLEMLSREQEYWEHYM